MKADIDYPISSPRRRIVPRIIFPEAPPEFVPSSDLCITPVESFAAIYVPHDTLESSTWFEWCVMLRALDDAEDTEHDQDAGPLVETWRALQRRGVIFARRLNMVMNDLVRNFAAEIRSEFDDWCESGDSCEYGELHQMYGPNSHMSAAERDARAAAKRRERRARHGK